MSAVSNLQIIMGTKLKDEVCHDTVVPDYMIDTGSAKKDGKADKKPKKKDRNGR